MMDKTEKNPFQGSYNPYFVGLLYKELPAFDTSLFLKRLEEEMKEVDVQVLVPSPALFLNIAYPLLAAERGESPEALSLKGIPLSHIVQFSSKMPRQEDLETALHQTFDWREAASVVSHCRATIWLNDMMAAHYPWKIRLGAFQAVLNLLLEQAPCEALLSLPTQKVINPELYQLSQIPGETFDPLYTAYNVRMFRIAKENETEPSDAVMDTLGMAFFDLPDVQCHFRHLDPGDVATKLSTIARYQFDQGDVFEDGEKIPFSEEEQWECAHEEALVSPRRIVLDLNPGELFAAGQRTDTIDTPE